MMVGEDDDTMVQMHVLGNSCLLSNAESYYTLQLHSFGVATAAKVENVHPLDGGVRETFLVSLPPTASAAVPTVARMRTFVRSNDSCAVPTGVMHASAAREGGEEGVSSWRGAWMPRALVPVGGDLMPFELASSRSMNVVCFRLTVEEGQTK